MCLAVPGQVQEIYEANGARMGKINFGGVVKEVCLSFVPAVAIGDYTIVHAGFAISRIDEQSALQTLRVFEELGILDEESNSDTTPLDSGTCPLPPRIEPLPRSETST